MGQLPLLPAAIPAHPEQRLSREALAVVVDGLLHHGRINNLIILIDEAVVIRHRELLLASPKGPLDCSMPEHVALPIPGLSRISVADDGVRRAVEALRDSDSTPWSIPHREDINAVEMVPLGTDRWSRDGADDRVVDSAPEDRSHPAGIDSRGVDDVGAVTIPGGEIRLPDVPGGVLPFEVLGRGGLDSGLLLGIDLLAVSLSASFELVADRNRGILAEPIDGLVEVLCPEHLGASFLRVDVESSPHLSECMRREQARWPAPEDCDVEHSAPDPL